MNWKHLLLTALVGSTTLLLSAQKINFSQSDLLANKVPKNLLNSLPQIVKWVDDEHVILNQKIHPDSAFKKFILDIKSGKISDWNEEASSTITA